jgi:hypothetical protein
MTLNEEHVAQLNMVLDFVVTDDDATAGGQRPNVALALVQRHVVDTVGEAIGVVQVGLAGDNVPPVFTVGKVLRDGLVQMPADQLAIVLPKGLLMLLRLRVV